MLLCLTAAAPDLYLNDLHMGVYACHERQPVALSLLVVVTTRVFQRGLNTQQWDPRSHKQSEKSRPRQMWRCHGALRFCRPCSRGRLVQLASPTKAMPSPRAPKASLRQCCRGLGYPSRLDFQDPPSQPCNGFVAAHSARRQPLSPVPASVLQGESERSWAGALA